MGLKGIKRAKPPLRKAVDIACIIHGVELGDFYREIGYSPTQAWMVFAGERSCPDLVRKTEAFIAGAGLKLREEILPIFEAAVKTVAARKPRVLVKRADKEKAA